MRLLPESVAFGGRPGTKIALFLDPPADAPTSEDVGDILNLPDNIVAEHDEERVGRAPVDDERPLHALDVHDELSAHHLTTERFPSCRGSPKNGATK